MPKGVPATGKRNLPALHGQDKLGLSREVPAALDEASKKFEQAAGGRDSLVAHLCHLPLTPEQDLIVGMIADPRNKIHSLGRICQLADITFGGLLELFRKAGFAKAQVEAMQKVWAKTPAVAEDVMTRALPHLLPCGPCRGRGWKKERVRDEETGKLKQPLAWEDKDCEACGGAGSITVQPEHERQRTALELAGLLNTPGSPNVQVNVQQNNAHFSSDHYQRFLAASDALLYPTPPGAPPDQPIEAEVLREEGVRLAPIGSPPKS